MSDSLLVLTEAQQVRDFIFGADDSVARWWIQDGASGWRLDVADSMSPEFQAMIRYFHREAGPEKGLLIWKWSRFSRDIDDAQFYRADLRRRGIATVVVVLPRVADGAVAQVLQGAGHTGAAVVLEGSHVDDRIGDSSSDASLFHGRLQAPA